MSRWSGLEEERGRILEWTRILEGWTAEFPLRRWPRMGRKNGGPERRWGVEHDSKGRRF